jgi:hypothetical protein
MVDEVYQFMNPKIQRLEERRESKIPEIPLYWFASGPMGGDTSAHNCHAVEFSITVPGRKQSIMVLTRLVHHDRRWYAILLLVFRRHIVSL